ncbi:MAG: hypothetical protein KF689_00840 [Gemmatimonadaceae bacterium]|nr:hypothetical protein [Gemmatimonadaceae bacterium]MCW5826475.1 hypothetical protein [Gemmatimonadaceae bacterium]
MLPYSRRVTVRDGVAVEVRDGYTLQLLPASDHLGRLTIDSMYARAVEQCDAHQELGDPARPCLPMRRVAANGVPQVFLWDPYPTFVDDEMAFRITRFLRQ